MKSDSKTSPELDKFNDALKTVLKVSPEELKQREEQWKKNKAETRARKNKK